MTTLVVIYFCVTLYYGLVCSWMYAQDGRSVETTFEAQTMKSSTQFQTMQIHSDTVRVAWIRHYTGPDSLEEAVDLTIDDLGNVYVTGRSWSSETEYDYVTIKYDSDGNEQWVARYNGPDDDWDNAEAIAVDSSGNVYVTGSSRAFGPGYDYLTIKYNMHGEEQWIARYHGGYAEAIITDESGSIYVTGTSGGCVTIKYDSSGNEEWVVRYKGIINQGAVPYDIAVDKLGFIYVTGSSSSSDIDPYDRDYFIIKYNSNGVEQWVSHYGGESNGYDIARAVVIDSSGNVYVTGTSRDSATSDDYATVKYNSDGVEQWVARYDGAGNYDKALDIVLDPWGNLYVTGASIGFSWGTDYVTVKYNSDGIEQWVSYYNGVEYGSDDAYYVDVDAWGNVYVSGISEPLPGQGPFSDFDFATVKYDSSGAERWVVRYEGPEDSRDWVRGFAVDDSGNVYVTGMSEGITGQRGWSVVTTIKYVRVPSVSIEEEPEGVPGNFLLHQNYPNPFNEVTTVRYVLKQTTHVTITVFNTLGKEIEVLVDGERSVGEHEVQWTASHFPSGVYIYRLEAGGFMETKKLVLLK